MKFPFNFPKIINSACQTVAQILHEDEVANFCWDAAHRGAMSVRLELGWCRLDLEYQKPLLASLSLAKEVSKLRPHGSMDVCMHLMTEKGQVVQKDHIGKKR